MSKPRRLGCHRKDRSPTGLRTTSVSPAVEHLEKRKAQNVLLSRAKYERVAYIKHENDFLTFSMDTLKGLS